MKEQTVIYLIKIIRTGLGIEHQISLSKNPKYVIFCTQTRLASKKKMNIQNMMNNMKS